MGIDQIIKTAPFAWSAGGVGSVGLVTGGWYLHEEVTNVSWDSKLLKEGYSFNSPSPLKLGVGVTSEEQFKNAGKLQSGDCFENFFPEAERITDLAEIKDEEKEDNTDDSQINESRQKPAIGCAIQKISYKKQLTEITNGSNKEWRVLPEYMVYKSEVTLKNDKFGMALWTLWTGESSETKSSQKFTSWSNNVEYKLFLLKNGDKRKI